MVKIHLIQYKIRSWIVKVAYYIFKIIGLAPFSIQIKTSTNQYHRWSKTVFLYSKTGLVYNILILILVCVLAFVSLQNWFIISHGRKYIPSAYFLFTIILVTRGMGIVLAVGLWTIKQKETIHIMNTLSEIDSLLKCLKYQALNNGMNISFGMSVIVAISWFYNPFMLANAQLDLFSVTNLFVNSLLIELPRILIYFFHIQYLFLLGSVYVNLVTVNKNLSYFTELKNFTRLRPPFADYLAMFRLRSNKSSELIAFQSLRAIRTRLSELAQNIADLFSFPILIVITFYFAYILEAIFCVVSYYSFPVVENVLSPDMLLVMVQMVQVLQPLVSLLEIIAQVKVEARLTSTIIGKAITTLVKGEITIELEDFSIQLLGEELEFTAYGLFPLTNVILHMTLAVTTTHLFVLWQASLPEPIAES